ncbi:PilT protein domain protein [Caldicellulosiruptor acetigenus I77R1B]|uniref:PilT protein domain protein n=1 Tax=Caldicellulosiruptor acetigenus (strain ATCC 700853 / DSM 12137 / I77R1B) TaxID=632335 RepID=E4S5G3_CALA7|nr:PIN domain-containing protein [Caldicellulosiruptor acetigenus]ADQ39624.1 PilT protein domain protein [Caldicellulosiruptor acetigenus I77R1B]
MKVLIDTNIILDVIFKRSPFEKDSYKVLKYAEEGLIEGYIVSFVVTDLYYFIAKDLGHDIAAKAIKSLLNVVKLVGITKKEIERAMENSTINDLEDALQIQCAKKIKADFIVTHDNKLKKLIMEAISPSEFVERLQKTDLKDFL